MNKDLLNKILQLPNRKNIVTNYGMFQDLHYFMKLYYDEGQWCRKLYIYILENYKTFKTKAK